ATNTRRRLSAEPEGSGELHRSDLVRGGGAEDVAAGSTAPRDRPVACGKASSGEGLHDAAAGSLDAQRDAGRTCELEGRSDAPVARSRSHEAEGVVEPELAVGNRVPPEIVVSDRPEGPGAFGLTLTGPA